MSTITVVIIFSTIFFLLGFVIGLVVAIYKEWQNEEEKLMKDFWKDLLNS